MVTTSKEGQGSTAEVKQITSQLEKLVQCYGLAREVGELIMANRKNGMRRYAGVHEIVPGLYLSGMAALQGDGKECREKGITAVLSLTDFNIEQLPSCVKIHKHVNVADSLSASLMAHFSPCVEWIKQATGLDLPNRCCVVFIDTISSNHRQSREDTRSLCTVWRVSRALHRLCAPI